MFSILAVLVILAVSPDAQADEVCRKIARVTQDEFVGGVEVWAWPKTAGLSSDTWAVGLNLEGNQPKLVVQYWEEGAVNGVLPAGTEVLLSFEGAELESVKSIQDAPRESDIEFEKIVTEVKLNLALSAEQVQKLASKALVGIRVPSSDGTRDLMLKPKHQKKMLSAALCVADNME